MVFCRRFFWGFWRRRGDLFGLLFFGYGRRRFRRFRRGSKKAGRWRFSRRFDLWAFFRRYGLRSDGLIIKRFSRCCPFRGRVAILWLSVYRRWRQVRGLGQKGFLEEPGLCIDLSPAMGAKTILQFADFRQRLVALRASLFHKLSC